MSKTARTSDDAAERMRKLVARLRFRHLQLLVKLRDRGSLRAAASELNLTQPALSKALAEVEAAFGVRLFERGSRGLSPTPQGAIATRGAAALLQELAHVSAESTTEPATMVLRIGAPPFIAQGMLPAALKRFFGSTFEAGERLRLQLHEERVPLLVEMLLNGRLDALVTGYPAAIPEAAGQPLRYEKLFDMAFAVIAPSGHPLARARRAAWPRLAEEAWIMPTESSMMRRMLQDMFWREGIVAPPPLIESTSAFTNLELVGAGLGLSAVPESTLGRGLASGQVQRVRVHPPLPPAPVALISRAGVDNWRVESLRRALRAK